MRLSVIIFFISFTCFSMDESYFLLHCKTGSFAPKQQATIDFFIRTYNNDCNDIWEGLTKDQVISLEHTSILFDHILYRPENVRIRPENFDLNFLLRIIEQNKNIKDLSFELYDQIDLNQYNFLNNLEKLTLTTYNRRALPLILPQGNSHVNLAVYLKTNGEHSSVVVDNLALFIKHQIRPGKIQNLSLGSIQFNQFGDFNQLPNIQHFKTSSAFNRSHLTLPNSQSLKSLALTRSYKKNAKAIEEIKLGDLPNLENLEVKSFKIKSMPSLAAYTKLKTINLYDNELQDFSFIEENLQVEKLWLAKNNFKGDSLEKAFSSTPFYGLAKINSLDLSLNKLSSIKGIKSFRYLRELKLEANYIEELNPLQRLKYLEMLHLTLSRSKDDPTAYISNHPWLKELKLIDLNIDSLDQLKGIPEIERIWLRSSHIKRLELSEAKPKLKYLDISYPFSGNQVDEIHRSLFIHAPLLKNLEVQSELKHLDISEGKEFEHVNLVGINTEHYKSFCNISKVDSLYLHNLDLNDSCVGHILNHSKKLIIDIPFDQKEIHFPILPTVREELTVKFPYYYFNRDYAINNPHFLGMTKSLKIKDLLKTELKLNSAHTEEMILENTALDKLYIKSKNLSSLTIAKSTIKEIELRKCKTLNKLDLYNAKSIPKLINIEKCSLKQLSSPVNAKSLTMINKIKNLQLLRSLPALHQEVITCPLKIQSAPLKSFCSRCNGLNTNSEQFKKQCVGLFTK